LINAQISLFDVIIIMKVVKTFVIALAEKAEPKLNNNEDKTHKVKNVEKS